MTDIVPITNDDISVVLDAPQHVAPHQVPQYAKAVLFLAYNANDSATVVDLHARWCALTEYLELTSSEGLAEAESTKMLLLQRIGELNPPQPGPGRGHQEKKNPDNGNLLGKNRMTEARKLAANPDIVNDVIDEGTDDDPPSKAKALKQIKAREEDRTRQIIELHEQGRTQREIADELGIAKSGVWKRLKEHGHIDEAKTQREQDRAARTNQIIDLRNQGLTAIEIAEQMGCATTTVYKHLNEAGLAPIAKMNREILNSITATGAGWADAAQENDGIVANPTAEEVARWTGDLDRVAREARKLKNRILKENQL